MDAIEGKIEDLGKQFSQLQKKLDKQKENGEKKVEEVIVTTKEEIEQLTNQIKQRYAHDKDIFYGDLMKTRYVLQQRKEKLERKRSEQRKRKAEIEVETAAEYAQAAMDFALLALDEATLAFYEAVDLADRYHQIYGDNE